MFSKNYKKLYEDQKRQNENDFKTIVALRERNSFQESLLNVYLLEIKKLNAACYRKNKYIKRLKNNKSINN